MSKKSIVTGISGKSEPVVSQPLKTLVNEGKSRKVVVECTEMHIGKKGFDKLAGFENLVNLEVLDASRNRLTYIGGLEKCFRIKRLYLNDNKIFTLRGPSLKAMRFVESLELSNNNLRDLQKVLPLLEHMRFLYQLEMKGNPCCEEPDYRLHVLHKIPSLHILDSHEVTTAEQHQTRVMFGYDLTSTSVAFGKRAPEKPERCPTMPLGGAISQLETELNSQIDAIKAQREAERIPEVTQVFGLTMAAALEKRERSRAIPPPPGWPDFTGLKITPDEEPRPNWVRPKKIKPLPDVGGVPGRPRAKDYSHLAHYSQPLLPHPPLDVPDEDEDYVPTVTLDKTRHDKYDEIRRLRSGPVLVDYHRELV
mmetsp:Transcript_4801/g.8262  ORF Transcript_4801/g.8262 Transcript_4801/m.8262 type:complete len:365 (+) Transcript_4801:281-1375(+)|eukprot:CAMPEP_0198207592 /NCGR_PEP_ID=MMETSP1445-20131203/11028_1 /TAXON_ID=36898 /ORGANISM="Pyramimonas sp., Strain CCMP2087" /LENGTH=364 /DNA_ID=CAMNT_0043880679 /DNA_START=281 /DNA_END=1375 /DNA_ORIENTATION=-